MIRKVLDELLVRQHDKSYKANSLLIVRNNISNNKRTII